jgi:hypothetical protein
MRRSGLSMKACYLESGCGDAAALLTSRRFVNVPARSGSVSIVASAPPA